jgi:hypothetical protein
MDSAFSLFWSKYTKFWRQLGRREPGTHLNGIAARGIELLNVGCNPLSMLYGTELNGEREYAIYR